jgi:ABC-type glutathione transport system ATPase component
VLLLDEPTTDLDPAGRHDVLGVIDRATRRGLHRVLIEHDAAAIERATRRPAARGSDRGGGRAHGVLGDVARCDGRRRARARRRARVRRARPRRSAARRRRRGRASAGAGVTLAPPPAPAAAPRRASRSCA